jgi:hypothetical protein
MKRFDKTPSSQLWKMIALGVAELAQRNPNALGSPRIEVRSINGQRQPVAMLTVFLQEAEADVPPMLCVGNATLNKNNQHHFEAIPVSKKLVAAVNRNAYRENSRLVS